MKLEDFPDHWKLTGHQAQRYIACFEVLAQIFIIAGLLQFLRSTSFRVVLPLQSDSVPTEGATNKLFTTSKPLKYFVQTLAAWCLTGSIKPVVSHLGGQRNFDADGLSRAKPETMARFSKHTRISHSLQYIWLQQPMARLFPAAANWPTRVFKAAQNVETALGRY